MTLEPLLNASPSIQIHTFAAVGAVGLGVLQFVAPKGTIPHRTVGWAWAASMAVMLITGFFINGLMAWGPFSPNVCYRPNHTLFFNIRCAGIHLATIFFMLIIPYAILYARKGDVNRHRHAMLFLMGGVLVTGVFTLDRARIMHAVLTKPMALSIPATGDPAIMASPQGRFPDDVRQAETRGEIALTSGGRE
jgi:uncharacterized membrane protein